MLDIQKMHIKEDRMLQSSTTLVIYTRVNRFLKTIAEIDMGVSIKNVILQKIKNGNWGTLKGRKSSNNQ